MFFILSGIVYESTLIPPMGMPQITDENEYISEDLLRTVDEAEEDITASDFPSFEEDVEVKVMEEGEVHISSFLPFEEDSELITAEEEDKVDIIAQLKQKYEFLKHKFYQHEEDKIHDQYEFVQELESLIQQKRSSE
jgi:hypothetical protein